MRTFIKVFQLDPDYQIISDYFAHRNSIHGAGFVEHMLNRCNRSYYNNYIEFFYSSLGGGTIKNDLQALYLKKLSIYDDRMFKMFQSNRMPELQWFDHKPL